MIVVFVMTYSLILPALTIEKNKAEAETGMYLGEETPGDTSDQETAESLESAEASQAATEQLSAVPVDETAAEPAAGHSEEYEASAAPVQSAGASADSIQIVYGQPSGDQSASGVIEAGNASNSENVSVDKNSNDGRSYETTDETQSIYTNHLTGIDPTTGIQVSLTFDRSDLIEADASLVVHEIPANLKPDAQGNLPENRNYTALLKDTEEAASARLETGASAGRSNDRDRDFEILHASYLSLSIVDGEGRVLFVPENAGMHAEITCPSAVFPYVDYAEDPAAIYAVQTDAHTTFDEQAQDPDAQLMPYAVSGKLQVKFLDKAQYRVNQSREETVFTMKLEKLDDLGFVIIGNLPEDADIAAGAGADQSDGVGFDVSSGMPADEADDGETQAGTIARSVDAQDESDEPGSADASDSHAELEEDLEAPAWSSGTLRSMEDGYEIAVSYDESAELPEGVTLDVRKLDENSREYGRLVERYRDASRNDADDAGSKSGQEQAVLFDITLLDAEGHELEPAAPVQVSIRMPELAEIEQEDVTLVHFTGTAQEVTGELENDTLSFEAESFSVYGVIYTVDFHWDVDGKTFTYSIPGGSAVKLIDILSLIGLVKDDPETDADELAVFTEEIADVEFSDESLVKVAHPEKDITLKELKEELGIEVDGEAYAIAQKDRGAEDESTFDGTTLPEGLLNELTDSNGFWPAKTAKDIAVTKESEVLAVEVSGEADVIPAGTWILISLQPFTSDETLTVTMNNGDVFSIHVTDKATNGNWDVWFDGTLGQSAQENKFYQGASNVHWEAANGQSITLPGVGQSGVTAPSLYNYTLNGWYDITTKKLYKPGDKVTITKYTVFYADWVPASYSKGSSTNTVETLDTSGFVKTELYDYNELINTHFSGTPTITVNAPNPWWSGNPNSHSETWNANNQFAFISWNYNWNPQNSIGMPGNRQLASEYRGKTLTTGIYDSNKDLINSLFNGDPLIGKTSVGQGTNLFQYDNNTGYYYYDSGKNAVTYNQDAGKFYVYNALEYLKHSNEALSNFLPFNDYPSNNKNSAPTENTGATNYWFGMKTTIDFYLPDDVNTTDANQVKNPKTNAQEDMVFKFSGDDDVWVLIDGKLVLDLGGIHDRAGGTINFTTGEVTTYFGEIDKPVAGTSTTSVNAALKSLESGNHTLEVLYLERGSSLSNCAIYFNLQPQPKTLEVAKKLVGLTQEELKKYEDETFTYEILIKRTGEETVHPYNTPANPKDRQKAIYHKRDGSTEQITITNGQVTLRHGEYITIPDLDRFDSLYVAEEKGLNMNQFEVPHAERNYHNLAGEEFEEEISLTQSHSNVADVDDWITPVYTPNETERVTFTNTLKERELEVRKIWEDTEPTSHDEIKFTVEAKDSTGQLVNIDALKNEDGSDKEFPLNEGNGWKHTIYQLPVMTPGNEAGKEITYTVKEVTEVPGYTSSTAPDAAGKCNIDAFKLWPDDILNHSEIIPIKLRIKDGQFYTGTVDGVPQFGNESSAKIENLDATHGYEHRFMDLPANNIYEVIQAADNDTHTRGISWYRRDIVDWTITNTPNPPGKITVEKQWMDTDGVTPLAEHPDHIEYTVYQLSHAHEWGKWDGETWIPNGWIRDVNPTETSEGHEYQVCKYDSTHKNERVLAKLDHVHDWKVTTIAPTCTEQGYTLHECQKDSSHNYKDAFVDAVGHSWGTATNYRNNSCTDPGLNEFECSVCHVKKIEEDPTRPALGHDWGEWTVDESKSNDEYIVKTRACKRDGCNAVDEVREPRPKNVYPGTSAPVDTLTNWPTQDQYPNDMSKTPNYNTKISFKKSGIFAFNGEYYVIYKDIPEQPANNFMQDNAINNLINSLNMCRLSGKVYYPDDWPNNMTKDTIQAGDVYEAADGKVYVFVERNDKNDFAPPPNPAKPNQWYLAYEPVAGNANGNNSNSTSNTNSVNRAMSVNRTSQKSMLRKLVNVANDSDNNSIGDTDSSGGQQGDASNASPTVVTTNLTEAQLKEALGVAELGVKNEVTGNKLVKLVYKGQDGSDQTTRTLNTVGSDTSWSVDIEVPLEDPNDPGIKYTYYVIETSPSGDSAEWETIYQGQENGLKDNGKVTITNKKKSVVSDIKILKKDNAGNGLSGARFRLQKYEESYQDIKSIKNGDGSLKYPDIGGVDDKSSFTSATNEISISKLPDGQYRLIEDSAPAGYVITIDHIDFTILNGKVVGTGLPGKYSFDENAALITVINEPGAALPNTGGSGTAWLHILGMAFTALSASGLVMSRRRKLVA